jgi:hypothetical protein
MPQSRFSLIPLNDKLVIKQTSSAATCREAAPLAQASLAVLRLMTRA